MVATCRAAAVLLCLSLTSVASAQITTGDIVGRVTDESGAVLPGATVTVDNVGTHEIRTTVTSATGDFVVNLLPIGSYQVRVELASFRSQESRVDLRSGERIRVDARLAIGGVSDTVQVSAEAPLLQTDSSTVSTLVTQNEVQDLPVNGRNFIRLIQLIPGASEGAANALASGTRPDDRRQTSAISINGAADNQNNLLIDGMDNNERAIGTIGVKPSMDAIAEMRVQTNMYSAEVGRTAGGVVNLLTKSGTNQFHGAAFGGFRNDRFDSRDYFATTDPILKQKGFGATLGGPVARQPDVLLRGLRRRPTAKWTGEQPDRAYAGDAQWRLFGAFADHLRSGGAGTDAVCQQPDSREPDRPYRRALRRAVSGADLIRARQQLREHDASNPEQHDGRWPYRSSDQREQLHVGTLFVQQVTHRDTTRMSTGQRRLRKLPPRATTRGSLVRTTRTRTRCRRTTSTSSARRRLPKSRAAT